MLGGSSSSLDSVGADEVAETGESIGTDEGRMMESVLVHVGEKRGGVPDVVLGERAASCRAADWLKNEGVRGLLCSLGGCTGGGVREQRLDDIGLEGVGDLSSDVNNDVDTAGGVGGVAGSGESTFCWGVHGPSTSSVPCDDGGLGTSSTSMLSGEPPPLSGSSLYSDWELLRCASSRGLLALGLWLLARLPARAACSRSRLHLCSSCSAISVARCSS